MKLLFKDDKGRAMCPECGLSSTTYLYKDVPISESDLIVKDILVGVCDQCEQVVTIPAQSTPAIKEVRERTSRSIEAVLPAPYLEVLDLAAYTLTPRASKDMRKASSSRFFWKSAESMSPAPSSIMPVRKVETPSLPAGSSSVPPLKE